MIQQEHRIKRKQDLIEERCKPEIYHFSEESWHAVKDQIIAIETLQFGEKGYSEKELFVGFSEKDNTAVVIRDIKTGKIVGFTVAAPADQIYGNSINGKPYYPERRKLEGVDISKIAYVDNTVIHPDYTGHGLVGPMIHMLEDTLRERGFQFLDQDAVEANNYAANIRKQYGSRILIDQPHDSKYGPQVFFRITVPHSPGSH